MFFLENYYVHNAALKAMISRVFYMGIYNVVVLAGAMSYSRKGASSSHRILGASAPPEFPQLGEGMSLLSYYHQREAVTSKSFSTHLSSFCCPVEVPLSAH